jgi:hypothetical protein
MLPGQTAWLATRWAIHISILPQPSDPWRGHDGQRHDQRQDPQRQYGAYEDVAAFEQHGQNGSIHSMVSDSPGIGSDTAATCWLCDRDGGELCHVHAQGAEGERELTDVAWTLPAAPEEA